ncbi:uncharacterized protein [Miscanthus floridulus]|uniref:uncharacterized protein n=1 Tax=Miscanthus floridulus TaxID=154761 RepID=UPI00345A7781
MELAHGHSRPAQPERGEEETAHQGVSPRPGSAWPAEAERHAGARSGATAGLGQRPAAVSGHGSASERAQETREEKESSVGSLGEAGGEREGGFHGGRAQRRHGRRRRDAGRLTQGSEGGASASVSKREAGRSCGRDELKNGSVVREFDAGGARARGEGGARALGEGGAKGQRGRSEGRARAAGSRARSSSSPPVRCAVRASRARGGHAAGVA